MDMESFCHFCFEDEIPGPFAQCHHDFFEWHLDERRGKSGLFLWPRENAKSTVISRWGTVHDFCYHNEDYVILFSDTKDQSEDKARSIKHDVSSNQRLLWLYGTQILPSESKTDPDRSMLFVLRNGCIFRASSWTTEARGFSDKGIRPTKLVLDDIQKQKTFSSPRLREELKRWYKTVASNIGGTKKPINECVCGTRMHPDDLLGEMERQPSFQVFKRSAFIAWPERIDLWNRWRELYNDLDDLSREKTAISFYMENRSNMDAGAKTLWPEKRSVQYPSKIYELFVLKNKIGEGAFNSEQQNEPVDPERTVFDYAAAQKFSLRIDEQGERYIERDGGHKIYLRDCSVRGCHDPSKGESMRREGRGDFGGHAIMARDKHSRLYLCYVQLRRDKISQQIETSLRLIDEWSPELFYVKETGTMGSLYDSYRRAIEERRKNGKSLSINPTFVNETENKIERIMHVEPHVANGWLLFERNLPQEFKTQISQFPNASHDDGPDVMHELWDRMKSGFLG